MLDLIRTAYGLDPSKVIGGPSWLDAIGIVRAQELSHAVSSACWVNAGHRSCAEIDNGGGAFLVDRHFLALPIISARAIQYQRHLSEKPSGHPFRN